MTPAPAVILLDTWQLQLTLHHRKVDFRIQSSCLFSNKKIHFYFFIIVMQEWMTTENRTASATVLRYLWTEEIQFSASEATHRYTPSILSLSSASSLLILTLQLHSGFSDLKPLHLRWATGLFYAPAPNLYFTQCNLSLYNLKCILTWWYVIWNVNTRRVLNQGAIL